MFITDVRTDDLKFEKWRTYSPVIKVIYSRWKSVKIRVKKLVRIS